MANRVLRSWIDSENVDKLSVHAEVVFTRLFMVADDYGCFNANPKLIKAAIFPLRDIRESDISRWLDECSTAGLIVFYEVNEKRYLVIKNFGQRLRQMKRRFPEPPNDEKQKSVSNPLSIVSELPRETKQNPKQESETKIINKNAIENLKNFFYLGIEIYKFPISSYIKNELQRFTNVWKLKLSVSIEEAEKTFENVLNQMDSDCIGKQFNNEEHIRNTFNLTYKNLISDKSKGVKTTQSGEKKIVATSNYGPKKS